MTGEVVYVLTRVDGVTFRGQLLAHNARGTELCLINGERIYVEKASVRSVQAIRPGA